MSSIRETARRIVNDRAAMSGDAYRADLKQVDAIEKALRDERERAAKIAETYYSSGGRYIAEKIRNGHEVKP